MDILYWIIYIIKLIWAFLVGLNKQPSSPSYPILWNTTTDLPILNQCPLGFVGDLCEIECGRSFFEQNQKIVGGISYFKIFSLKFKFKLIKQKY
jgi:hypothetical protein